jgi:hypothetical protein
MFDRLKFPQEDKLKVARKVAFKVYEGILILRISVLNLQDENYISSAPIMLIATQKKRVQRKKAYQRYKRKAIECDQIVRLERMDSKSSVNTIGLLPSKFFRNEGRKALVGDVFVTDQVVAEWIDPTNQLDGIKESGIFFAELTEGMANHLKPLYIKAQINGKPISRVFVGRVVILNVMPLSTLKKLGRSVADLGATNMQITSFTATPTL